MVFSISSSFEMIKPFSEGLALVVIDNKGGFIDKKGNMIIPPNSMAQERFLKGWLRLKLAGNGGISVVSIQRSRSQLYDDKRIGIGIVDFPGICTK